MLQSVAVTVFCYTLQPVKAATLKWCDICRNVVKICCMVATCFKAQFLRLSVPFWDTLRLNESQALDCIRDDCTNVSSTVAASFHFCFVTLSPIELSYLCSGF